MNNRRNSFFRPITFQSSKKTVFKIQSNFWQKRKNSHLIKNGELMNARVGKYQCSLCLKTFPMYEEKYGGRIPQKEHLVPTRMLWIRNGQDICAVKKTCFKCKSIKPLSAFGIRPNRNNTFYSYCKPCKNAMSKELAKTEQRKAYLSNYQRQH